MWTRHQVKSTWYVVKGKRYQVNVAQLTGAVEYTDYISAEG